MKSLSEIKTGSAAVIVSIRGGKSVIHRLAELGILPWERITMFHNAGLGPVTVCVKGARLAIGHDLARKIIVREEQNGG